MVVVGLGLELLMPVPNKIVAAIFDGSLISKVPLASRQACFALGTLLVCLALAKSNAISRVFLVGFAVFLYGTLLWSSAVLPSILAKHFFHRNRETPTLLVGPSGRVAGLETWLARKQLFGVRVVGLISTDAKIAEGAGEGTVPDLGGLDRLDEVLQSARVTQLICLEMPRPEVARLLSAKCEQHGLRLLFVNDFAEHVNHPIICCVDEGVNLVCLRDEPLENPFNRTVKRALDLALVFAVVIFVMPWLVAIVWLCHRLQSPGPLWHRQKRSGLQNRPFEIFKFRTMHVGGDVTRQATVGDARIFPAGRWLRKFSLDEIPQFLNVFFGDMSVVGPRPHLVEHNRQFAEALSNYHIRALVKPGITGLAQVRGFRGEARTRADISARLQSDLVYLENWSLSLDFGIILRTFWHMIRPPRTAV